MVKVIGKSGEEFFDVVDIDATKIRDIFPNISIPQSAEFTGKYKRNYDEVYYITLNGDDYNIVSSYVNIFDNLVRANALSRERFSSMNVTFCKVENKIFFQRIYNKNVIKQSYFHYDGQNCSYEDNQNIVVVSNQTDAMYDIANHRLYFYDFSVLKGLFKEVEKFYRVASDADIANFFENPILTLQDDAKLGTRSRIRIATMKDDGVLNNKTNVDVKKWMKYAKKYKQTFPSTDGTNIVVAHNKDIDGLYDAVYENYYTTALSHKQRKTNSWKDIKTTNP